MTFSHLDDWIDVDRIGERSHRVLLLLGGRRGDGGGGVGGSDVSLVVAHVRLAENFSPALSASEHCFDGLCRDDFEEAG